MSYAFQQDVVLLLSPILHRMLHFANLHPECRNKYRRAAVLPSPEGLQLNSPGLWPRACQISYILLSSLSLILSQIVKNLL